MKRFLWALLCLVGCTAPVESEPPRASTTTAAETVTPAPAAAEANPATEPFHRGAAAGALGRVNAASCRLPGGPTGPGHVTVLFAVDGHATVKDLDPPYEGTDVGRCIAEKYAAATVPPFTGAPVRVGMSFKLKPE